MYVIAGYISSFRKLAEFNGISVEQNEAIYHSQLPKKNCQNIFS